MNDNFIKEFHIQNYKSVKNLKVECKRINMFIGKPNVGKSNILEALGLLSFPETNSFELNGTLLRFNSMQDFFYENEVDNPIIIETKNKCILISSENQNNSFYCTALDISEIGDVSEEELSLIYRLYNIAIQRKLKDNTEREIGYYFSRRLLNNSNLSRNEVDNLIQIAGGLDYYTKVFTIEGLEHPFLKVNNKEFIDSFYFNVYPKYYKFSGFHSSIERKGKILRHPNGENIISVLEGNKELRVKVGEIFKEYGYDLVLNKSNWQLGIQKNVDNIIFQVQLSLVADTLQRFIFHLAAIKSNHGSILVFEEPEAHCFPAYISYKRDC